MDMDAQRVFAVIGNNERFISPFAEPGAYHIWQDGGEPVAETAVQACWQKLQSMAAHADKRIGQAFNPAFYEFYGVNRRAVASPSEMCRRLRIESFVFVPSTQTVVCCLSNPDFMFGHFIDCAWGGGWELLYTAIC